ncbi:MAG: MarR family transcriptional regulator [Sandarakinorhabdus sp.]|nr:MarR family transcriptional regulator [Sandarakinorhabdus sp.]
MTAMDQSTSSAPVSAPGPGNCTAAKVRRLARKVTQIYDDALAPHGLTIGQMGLLATLRRREGVSIGALADRLSADASTVSRLLKPLLSIGYLTLEADPDDRRAKLVRLTQAGHDKRRAAAAGWNAAQASMAGALGGGRLAALHFMLDDAHHHL